LHKPSELREYTTLEEQPKILFYDDYREASVSVIIPVYNEAGAIGQLLERVIAAMRELGRPWEVVVVDDGSNDGTLDEIKDQDVTIIAHPYNIGNGAAIKTGIRYCSGEIVVMMDGDGQHDPRDIPQLVARIGPYDMVVGARVDGFNQNRHRTLANHLYNLLASYVTHFKVKDLTSGFRSIKANILKRHTYLLPNTFSYPTTLTLSLLRAGHSLRYEPVHTQEREGKSKIKLLRDGVRFLLIIFKIATLFSPLKVFLPFSGLFLLMGLVNYTHTYIAERRLTNMTVIFFITSLFFFLLGMVSEQIAQLRFDRAEENG
jgi:glycosyltransferase involved in cell wall biosynthesis